MIDKVVIIDEIDNIAGDGIADEFTGSVIVLAMGIPAGLRILSDPDGCIRILIINIDHVKNDGTRHAAHSLSLADFQLLWPETCMLAYSSRAEMVPKTSSSLAKQ